MVERNKSQSVKLDIRPDVAYTFEEARALLRIGKNLMRELIRTDEIRAKQVGKRKYRILGSNILSYLDRNGDMR